MRASFLSWFAASGVMVGVGLLSAVVLMPFAAVAVAALLGAASLWMLEQGDAMQAASGGPLLTAERVDSEPSFRGMAGRAALAGGGLVAFLGLLTLTGAYALMMLAMLCVTSPPVVAWLSRRRSRRRCVEAAGVDATAVVASQRSPEPSRELSAPATMTYSEMSDEALCWRWRATFPELERTMAKDQFCEVYRARAALLDEMDRRNPSGLQRWLTSGARAAGNPLPFITSCNW